MIEISLTTKEQETSIHPSLVQGDCRIEHMG